MSREILGVKFCGGGVGGVGGFVGFNFSLFRCLQRCHKVVTGSRRRRKKKESILLFKKDECFELLCSLSFSPEGKQVMYSWKAPTSMIKVQMATQIEPAAQKEKTFPAQFDSFSALFGRVHRDGYYFLSSSTGFFHLFPLSFLLLWLRRRRRRNSSNCHAQKKDKEKSLKAEKFPLFLIFLLSSCDGCLLFSLSLSTDVVVKKF